MTEIFAISGDNVFVFNVPGNFPCTAYREPGYPFYFVREFPKKHGDGIPAIVSATKIMLEMLMGDISYHTMAPVVENAINGDSEKFKSSIIDFGTDLIAVTLVVPHACPNCAA